jgi:hypothetical protein
MIYWKILYKYIDFILKVPQDALKLLQIIKVIKKY